MNDIFFRIMLLPVQLAVLIYTVIDYYMKRKEFLKGGGLVYMSLYEYFDLVYNR